MIRYQSEQPTKNWRLGIKRAFVSFNPFIVGSFLGIMLIILGGILLFGGRIYNNLIWVIPLSLLITVTWFFLYYKVKILPDFIRTRRKLLERDSPEFQEDIYTKEGIKQNVYGKMLHYDYSELKGIYFFSDIIFVRDKTQIIMYYARDSFVHATEEEWVQFMKTQNPKIKVRRFKFDYIWYL